MRWLGEVGHICTCHVGSTGQRTADDGWVAPATAWQRAAGACKECTYASPVVVKVVSSTACSSLSIWLLRLRQIRSGFFCVFG